MTNANTNAHNLHAVFHPAAQYDSPRSVLSDNELSTPEKRIILSSCPPTCMRWNRVRSCAKFPA